MAEKKTVETDASKSMKTSEELAAEGQAQGADTAGGARPSPGAASPVGTAEDVARQGFTGVKVQADQQASAPGAEGGDVPMGGNPLKSVYRDAEARKGTKEFTVEDSKFHFGGEQFSKGDKIHLTPEEYGRARSHLKEKSLRQDEGSRVESDR